MGIFKPNISKLSRKGNIKGLIKALKYKNSYLVRAWAAQALGRFRIKEDVKNMTVMEQAIYDKSICVRRNITIDIAVEPLILSLKDENAWVRSSVAEALGNIGDKRAVEALIQVLNNEDSNVRQSASKALGNIRDLRVAESLIKTLKDENKDVRKNSAESLDRIGWTPRNDEEKSYYLCAQQKWNELKEMGKTAVEPLILASKHNSRKETETVIRALGNIGDKRAVEALILNLKYKDVKLRSVVAEALGNIGDKRAVEALIHALNDEDSNVRQSATKALGNIGEPVIETLISVLNSENHYNVLEGASKALIDIGEPAVKSLINVLINTSWFNKSRFAEILNMLGWNPGNDLEKANYLIANRKWKELEGLEDLVIELLIPTLKNEDSSVRSSVAEALGNIGDKRAVEALIQALNDEDSNVRQSATKALGNIGDLRAAEAIINEFFIHPLKVGDDMEELKFWSIVLKSIFEDYTDIILKSSMYIQLVEDNSRLNTIDQRYHYNINKCNEAVLKLCRILTQISTNILHKVSQKKDIRVIVSYYSCLASSSSYGLLSFKSQRDMAEKEIERRGNPPYDPSAYLYKEAWKV